MNETANMNINYINLSTNLKIKKLHDIIHSRVVSLIIANVRCLLKKVVL